MEATALLTGGYASAHFFRRRDTSHCFVSLSGPLFATVPNSPREVMSVIPVNEVPLTVP